MSFDVDINEVPMVVDFWSDLGCPWASLSVYRFRAARSAMGLDGRVVLRHRAFPLELINAQGTPKPVLDSERDVLMELEPELHWRPWRIDEWLYPGSLLLALEAVRASQLADVGGLQASEDLDSALRHAFYAEGRPIGLHTEILSVASGCQAVDEAALAHHLERGTARSQLFEDFRGWQERGVQGSPHLFLPDGTDAHNPGVAIEWHEDEAGEWHVTVLSDRPEAYRDLLAAAVTPEPASTN